MAMHETYGQTLAETLFTKLSTQYKWLRVELFAFAYGEFNSKHMGYAQWQAA